MREKAVSGKRGITNVIHKDLTPLRRAAGTSHREAAAAAAKAALGAAAETATGIVSALETGFGFSILCAAKSVSRSLNSQEFKVLPREHIPVFP